MSEKHLTKTRFDSFPLSESIMTGVRDAGSASFYAVPVAAELLGFRYELVTGYVGSAARTLAAPCAIRISAAEQIVPQVVAMLSCAPLGSYLRLVRIL